VSEFPSKYDPTRQAVLANVAAIRPTLTELADQVGILDPDEFARQFN
jgi:hypothetical protein